MLEKDFKRITKRRIKEMFPDCFIHEMMCQQQGIPDTLIIFGERWALLEFKESAKAKHRPNQDYYIQKFNEMGFASFVYPENVEEVLTDLERWFYE